MTNGVRNVAPVLRIICAMASTPEALISALTRVWDDLRTRIPELPPAWITVTTSPTSPAHGPERWALDDHGTLLGLFVGTDVLAKGAEAAVTQLIHEAAHVLNWQRHIQDVSSRNVYHNHEFLSAAQELGLYWPADAERITGRGLATPVMTEETEAQLRALAAEAQPLIDAHLDVVAGSVEPPPPRRDRLTLVCACDPVRRIRAAQSSVDAGPIICGVCGEEFAAQ